MVRAGFVGHHQGAEPHTIVVSMVTWTQKISLDHSLETISVSTTVSFSPSVLYNYSSYVHDTSPVFMDIPRRRTHFTYHHGNRREVKWLPW